MLLGMARETTQSTNVMHEQGNGTCTVVHEITECINPFQTLWVMSSVLLTINTNYK